MGVRAPPALIKWNLIVSMLGPAGSPLDLCQQILYLKKTIPLDVQICADKFQKKHILSIAEGASSKNLEDGQTIGVHGFLDVSRLAGIFQEIDLPGDIRAHVWHCTASTSAGLRFDNLPFPHGEKSTIKLGCKQGGQKFIRFHSDMLSILIQPPGHPGTPCQDTIVFQVAGIFTFGIDFAFCTAFWLREAHS
eukprot:598912-Pelagomonas_calceolata.AAC.1